MRAFALTFIAGLSGLALAQSVPVPFNAVTSGTVSATGLDAGSAFVQGATVVGGKTTSLGGVVADGGLSVGSSGSQQMCFGVYGPSASYAGLGSGACSSNTMVSPVLTTDGTNLNLSPVSAGGSVTLLNNGSGKLNVNSSGVEFGAGNAVSNLSVGSCSLSSGQCNAVVPGAQGSSLCVASVQGTSQTLVGCDVRADAGSATAFCVSTASGTVALVCFN